MIIPLRAARAAMGLRLAFFCIASLLSVGCKDKPRPSVVVDLPEVPVVAPFDQMRLPTSGGRVWQCTGPGTLRNPATMRVTHDGADKLTLGGRYTAAIKGAGWAQRKPPTLAPDHLLWLYEDPETERMLTLEVMDTTFDGGAPKGAEVTITILVARPR